MAHTYGRASALKTVRNVGTWNLEFVENSFRNLSKFENEILIKKKKKGKKCRSSSLVFVDIVKKIRCVDK